MALSDNLQGWWCPSLDTSGNGTTTLTDLSGNGNNGTLTNMDAGTDWVADTGSGGVRALDFDGINDYTTASVAAVDFPVSVSVWVNLDPLDTDARGVFSVSDPTASNKYIEVGLSGSLTSVEPGTPGSGRLRIDVRDANTERVYGTTVVPVSQWVHIVAVWESQSTRKVYLDGTIEIDDATSSNGIPANLTSVSIGQLRAVSPTWYTTCRSDNVALYDRALTPAEVTELYNGGRSLRLTNLSTGLQGWWCPSLDTAGNGTTTLTDLSGNGNNGTLTNMDAATDWVADTDSGGVRALDFDGGNDRVASFSDGTVNRALEGDTWTVSFWSKPFAVAIALSFSDVSITSRWTGFYPTNGGKVQLNRLGVSGGSQIFQSSTAPVVSGDWALFTYCFSSSGLVIYHNGTQLTTAMFAGSNTGSTYTAGQLDTINFSALERSSGVSTYLQQSLDNVAIWDRTLTSDEVSQLYNGGRSLNLLASGGDVNIAHVLRAMQQQQESVVTL